MSTQDERDTGRPIDDVDRPDELDGEDPRVVPDSPAPLEPPAAKDPIDGALNDERPGPGV